MPAVDESHACPRPRDAPNRPQLRLGTALRGRRAPGGAAGPSEGAPSSPGGSATTLPSTPHCAEHVRHPPSPSCGDAPGLRLLILAYRPRNFTANLAPALREMSVTVLDAHSLPHLLRTRPRGQHFARVHGWGCGFGCPCAPPTLAAPHWTRELAARYATLPVHDGEQTPCDTALAPRPSCPIAAVKRMGERRSRHGSAEHRGSIFA